MIDKQQEQSPEPTEVASLIQIKQADMLKSSSTSQQTRQTMLTTLAESLVTSADRNKAQGDIRRIKQHEASAAIWKMLAHFSSSESPHQKLDCLEVSESRPASHVPVTNTADLKDPKNLQTWKTITDPVEIEYYLMLRNQMHFGQAQGTPFTTASLTEHLNWTASTPAADEILQGSYVPSPEVSQMCTEVLAECRALAQLDSIPAEMTAEAFEGKIKAWREATTTSPSGRHLGRYKALYAPSTYLPDPDENKDGDYEQFLAKQQDIAKVVVQIINFCIRHGHVLCRWKQIVNTMIFKDTGVYCIRVIHIYKADFNLLLAVKWRELLCAADQGAIINKGQFGGRPGHKAKYLALLEELRIDISYLTRRTLITFFASLINRKYGLHRQLAVVHGKTLKEVQFKLRTAIGISESEYSHSTQFPLYGSGQGSGNSPALWLFISATLFDVHD